MNIPNNQTGGVKILQRLIPNLKTFYIMQTGIDFLTLNRYTLCEVIIIYNRNSFQR